MNPAYNSKITIKWNFQEQSVFQFLTLENV